jgi:hypothetical protein
VSRRSSRSSRREASDIAKSMVLDGSRAACCEVGRTTKRALRDDRATRDRSGPACISSARAASTPPPALPHGGSTADPPGRRSGPAAVRSATVHPEDPSDSSEYSASDFAIAQFARPGRHRQVQHYMTRAHVVGATCSTPSRSTSTTATPTAPGRGRSTRPARAATPRATPRSTPGWSPTTTSP